MSENEEERIENYEKWLNEHSEDECIECCPICCSENIIVQGHCKTCFDCGWSLCSL